MNDHHLFVDENLDTYTGQFARERLSSTNDLGYLQEGKGIVRVPKTRWATAQAYERRTWMEAAAHAREDRNEAHMEAFGGYEALAGRRFQRAIELGCGPFTNLRLLTQKVEVSRCTLLDPLAESYLQHRHCSYSKRQLRLRPSRLDQALAGSLPLRAVRRLVRAIAPEALHDGVPVERIIATPIEEMPECGGFDLVVIVNVLEHCFDAESIFDRLLQLTYPGSVLVFHDRLYMPEEMATDLANRYEAGHPLRIAAPVIRDFLTVNFKALHENEIDLLDQSHGLDLTERGLYFIGVRR